MTVSISGGFDGLRNLLKDLQTLNEKAVYVGFPAEMNKPVEDAPEFNLASLAAVLEFGNQHIPSRPFLRQTLKENQQKYAAFFVQQFKKGLTVEVIYQQLANVVQGDVQENIVNGKWAKNAPSTVKAWMRDKKIKGDPSAVNKKPLIWNSTLKNSVRAVVK